MVDTNDILNLLPTNRAEVVPGVEEMCTGAAEDQMVTWSQHAIPQTVQANGTFRVLGVGVPCGKERSNQAHVL